MRISDWSSDVCSSDLGEYAVPGPASDVWGIGATLFHAVSGYLPFDQGEPDAHTPLEIWPQLGPTIYDVPAFVPDEVGTVIHACLESDPDDRPAPREDRKSTRLNSSH